MRMVSLIGFSAFMTDGHPAGACQAANAIVR